MVNDGSTDNSQTIIDEYCILDSRFVGLWKRNEGSVAKPRYYAMRFVKSDFVIMLDADDILGDDDYVEKLLNRQREIDADITLSCMCGFEKETSNIVWTIPDNHFDYGQVLDGRSACLLTIPSWQISLNGCLARKELFDSLSEGDWANWDEVHSRELLIKSKRVAFSNSKYYYRFNPSSITRALSPYMFDRTINDAQMVRFAQLHFPDDDALINELARNHFSRLRQTISNYEKLKDKLSMEAQKRVERVLAQSYHFTDLGLLMKRSLKWGLAVAILRRYSWFQCLVLLKNHCDSLNEIKSSK